MKFEKLIIVALLAVTCASGAWAQSITRVRGVVTDADTGEPLPFVSVTFPGTTVGTSTDMEGVYSLETREGVTELNASYLSYVPQTVPVRPGVFNRIDFSLKQIVEDIGTVLIVPGENPAYAILDSVSKYKYRNDPAFKDTYSYSAYTKMELDLANFTEFPGKRMQRDFGFVFEYMDTSAMTGRAYLPVMITESSTDYYHRRSPRLNREIVKASRISGLNDYNFAQFTGGMYVDVNIYDNYVNIFEVNIPSPLSDHGRLFYEYYLIDSLQYDGRKTYYIRFHPRSSATAVFDGEVNIDSVDWALHSARMKLAKGINLNWLRDLYIENHNQLLGDSVWFKKQNRVVADLAFTKSDSSELISFMAQRQIDYMNVRINEPIPPDILALSTNVVRRGTEFVEDEAFWAQARPYELSERERNIYMMVDSVKDAPLYTNVYDLANTLVVGYKKLGPVEVGSIYRLFSFNDLEGGRFQLGLRTNKDLSRRVRLSGYGAYGLKDEMWKGGGSVEFLFRKEPFSKLTLSGRHDVLQLSAGRELFSHGNILGSIFARGDTKRLVFQDTGLLQLEHEWVSGIVNTFSAGWQELRPTRYVAFRRPDGTDAARLRSFEVSIGTRLSKDEAVIRKPFDLVNVFTNHPVFNVELTAGLKDVLGSENEYYRVTGNMKYRINTPPAGRGLLDVTVGKIFGQVPYPLLKMHEGNATYFYDKTAFSCMNFYEFASDAWVSVIYEHHFRGMFLNYIPLLKRLQWREVFIFRGLWGTLSPRNDGSAAGHGALMDFPQGMSSVSKPYIETGVGIENIFRLFRVDALWRMTHLKPSSENGTVNNFVLNFSIQIDF